MLADHQTLTPVHRHILVLCFLAWIFDFYDLILYSFLLVPIAREMHLSPVDSSLVLGFSFLLTAMGGIAFGAVADRWGRRPVVALCVLIYGVGTLMCASATSLWHLLLFRAITGLGVGGEWAAGQSLIAETFPARTRARYAAYVQTGAPLGVLVAAVAGGFVAPALGWRAVFALSAVPALAVSAAVWTWLPESDVWRQGQSRSRFNWDGIIALRPYRRTALVLFFFLLVNSEAYWFTYSWMPGYLELKRGLGPHGSSRLMIVMQIAAVAGYMAFGRIADHLGRRPTFFIFGALMSAGLLPPTLLWPWAIKIPGLITAGLALVGAGSGMWSGAGPLISELFPTRVRATVLGLMMNLTRGVQFFTPLAIAWLSQRIGFGAALAVGSVFSLIGMGLIWQLPETMGWSITQLDSP